MITLRNAAFAIALLASGAAVQSATAMPAANLAGLANANVAASAFVLDEALAPGRPARLDRVDADAAETAAADYFGFDALISLGALALAGGVLAAFAAAAARREAKMNATGEPAWRETVFRALQADLAAFTASYRRAA
jgi:hypothetical protein